MNLSVASSLHGIKITAEQGLKSATASTLLNKLDALSTQLTKIYGWHPWKYGVAYIKTHVDINPIGCTHQSWQK